MRCFKINLVIDFDEVSFCFCFVFHKFVMFSMVSFVSIFADPMHNCRIHKYLDFFHIQMQVMVCLKRKRPFPKILMSISVCKASQIAVINLHWKWKMKKETMTPLMTSQTKT